MKTVTIELTEEEIDDLVDWLDYAADRLSSFPEVHPRIRQMQAKLGLAHQSGFRDPHGHICYHVT